VTEMPNHPQESNAADEMCELMLRIVLALVEDPGHVRVQAIAGLDSVVLQLSVASVDLGRVIGKQGRTARALRTVLGAASMKLRQRFTLDIVEEDPARVR